MTKFYSVFLHFTSSMRDSIHTDSHLSAPQHTHLLMNGLNGVS